MFNKWIRIHKTKYKGIVQKLISAIKNSSPQKLISVMKNISQYTKILTLNLLLLDGVISYKICIKMMFLNISIYIYLCNLSQGQGLLRCTYHTPLHLNLWPQQMFLNIKFIYKLLSIFKYLLFSTWTFHLYKLLNYLNTIPLKN